MSNDIFGNSNLPSCIVNPFNVENITSIMIVYGRSLLRGTPYFTGKVEFKKGNTKGEQSFDGKNLVDVFIKVRDFCKELERYGEQKG